MKSRDKNFMVKISISVALLASIFTGLAYSIFAVILQWIIDAETQWNLNADALGNLMGVMVILFAGAGLFGAYYADKIYKKPVAIIGGIFTGINCILIGLSWSYEIFVVAIILIGVGNGIISPVIFALIADVTPAEKRSTNYGYFVFAGLLGVIFGLMIFIGFLSVGEWRIPYIITGIITISLSLLILSVKLPKRGGRENALEQILEEENVEYDYNINFKDLKNIFKRKSNIILILNFSDAFPSGVFMFATLWLTIGHGLNKNLVLIPTALIMVSRFISPLFWGKIADKVLKKTQDELSKIKICILLMLVYTPIFIVVILIPWDASGISDFGELLAMPSFTIFFLGLIVAYFISSGTQPIWQGAITEINFPEHRATSSQIALFVDQLGVALGVIIAGYLIQALSPNGFNIAFIIAAFTGLINMFTWFLALRYYKDDKKFVENVLLERAEELKKK